MSLPQYQIEYSPDLGIMLWLETPCGIKQPVMRWFELEELKAFSESLLNFYTYHNSLLQETARQKAEHDSDVAERLLRQVFSDENDCSSKAG